MEKLIKFKRYGGRIYLFQESSVDPRGNRYLGPLKTPKELEIVGYRAILAAKRFETDQEGSDEASA